MICYSGRKRRIFTVEAKILHFVQDDKKKDDKNKDDKKKDDKIKDDKKKD